MPIVYNKIIAINLQSFSPAPLPNGIDTLFVFKLDHAPIAGQVTVHWTSENVEKTMVFNASPVEITGDGNPADSTINRITGEIRLDTTGHTPQVDSNITVDYRIEPIVTLKNSYPMNVAQISGARTDIEFKVPFTDQYDIEGISDGYNLCAWFLNLGRDFV